MIFSDVPEETQAEDCLYVRFLEIGVIDAILINSGHETMLIDGGTENQRNPLKKALKKYGAEAPDYLVNTHPHADHIGAQTMNIKCGALKPGMLLTAWPLSSQNKLQKKLLSVIRSKGIQAKQVFSGETLMLGKAKLTFLRWDDGITTNHKSLIIRIEFGETTLLLTSDASGKAEKWMMENLPAELLKADVLKIPHHGVDRLVAGYLEAVDPQLCIFSKRAAAVRATAEQVNKYGAERMHSANGTILLVSDGKDWYASQLEKEL